VHAVRVSAIIPLCLLSGCGAFAQAPDNSLTFEVASVKPHPPAAGGPAGSSFNGGPGTSDPGRITVINRMLSTLIIEAYGIRAFQLERPAWVAENRFDIIAKVPPGTTPQQAKVMMRNLLVERFDLQIRREMRDVPVYAMVIAKDGLKMKPSVDNPAGQPPTPADPNVFDKLKPGGDGFPQLPPSAQTIMLTSNGESSKAIGQRQSLSKIVAWLRAEADRPVIDETGLQGNYDFSVTWTPDQNGPGGDYAVIPAVEKQLGLKLEPRRMPTEMLIVVSALKVPKEN
jgi:uncharacterized protein (TIGR03435 family)